MTKVFKLSHSEFYKEFDPWRKDQSSKPPINGLYIVKSNTPIPRCLKPDPEGILYIGQGNILSDSNRIGKLVNSFNGEENVHEAGTRYRSNERLKSSFPSEQLIIEVTLIEDPQTMEKDLLRNYFNEFGDVPPLNRIAY